MNDKFVMYGCREILKIAETGVFLEKQIAALERAVIESPELVFDLAKTLIESVCKTILTDRGIKPDSKQDAPALLKTTLNHLQLLPSGKSDAKKTLEGLDKTIRGLEQVVQGLTEIRNKEGFASHGQDALHKPLEKVQAMLAAQAADTVAHFLYSVHKAYFKSGTAVRLYYSANAEFNDYIDDSQGLIQIFDLTYKASEVLFAIDLEAYRDILNNYFGEIADNNDSI